MSVLQSNLFKSIFIVFVLILVIDVPVTFIYNNNFYKKNFDIINDKNQSNVESRTRDKDYKKILFYILILLSCYLLISVGTYYFCVKNNINDKFKSFQCGLIFGFITYGIHNFSTLLAINKYNFNTAIIDTIWGSMLTGITSIISVYLIDKYVINSLDSLDSLNSLDSLDSLGSLGSLDAMNSMNSLNAIDQISQVNSQF